ncbi:MAG TPA: preprotein translocase subunit Sec61beta [Nitrososphaeraceae archaeon]|nr:preprotein translocase subunit Sec61beta [Nitrososphaeraceae archaeon]
MPGVFLTIPVLNVSCGVPITPHHTVSILIFNRNLFNRVKALQIVAMSSSSKKKNAPLPASSAGLLRFFEDETKGVKIKPELVLSIAGGIIGVSILIRLIFPV